MNDKHQHPRSVEGRDSSARFWRVFSVVAVVIVGVAAVALAVTALAMR